MFFNHHFIIIDNVSDQSRQYSKELFYAWGFSYNMWNIPFQREWVQSLKQKAGLTEKVDNHHCDTRHLWLGL